MVIPVKPRPHIVLWLGFAAIMLLTWIAYTYWWGLPAYFTILQVSAAIHFGWGLWLLITTRFAWRAVILVAMGLAVGQLWLIQMGIMFLAWSIHGFAP